MGGSPICSDMTIFSISAPIKRRSIPTIDSTAALRSSTFRLKHLFAAEREQLPGQRRGAFAHLPHRLQALLNFGIARLRGERGLPTWPNKMAIMLLKSCAMPPAKATDRFPEFHGPGAIALHDARFNSDSPLALFGDIAEDHDNPGHCAGIVANRGEPGILNRHFRAVPSFEERLRE